MMITVFVTIELLSVPNRLRWVVLCVPQSWPLLIDDCKDIAHVVPSRYQVTSKQSSCCVPVLQLFPSTSAFRIVLSAVQHVMLDRKCYDWYIA
jgi:hypothetical protein